MARTFSPAATSALLLLAGVQSAGAAECTAAQKGDSCCAVFDLEGWTTTAEGGGSWEQTANTLRYNFENDRQCGGAAELRQKGEATMSVQVPAGDTWKIEIAMEGRAEAQYETYRLFVDGALEVTEQAAEADGCKRQTCVACPVTMGARTFPLGAGSHSFKVEVDAIDGLYNKDSYFSMTFSRFDCGCTCSAESSPKDLSEALEMGKDAALESFQEVRGRRDPMWSGAWKAVPVGACALLAGFAVAGLAMRSAVSSRAPPLVVTAAEEGLEG